MKLVIPSNPFEQVLELLITVVFNLVAITTTLCVCFYVKLPWKEVFLYVGIASAVTTVVCLWFCFTESDSEVMAEDDELSYPVPRKLPKLPSMGIPLFITGILSLGVLGFLFIYDLLLNPKSPKNYPK